MLMPSPAFSSSVHTYLCKLDGLVITIVAKTKKVNDHRRPTFSPWAAWSAPTETLQPFSSLLSAQCCPLLDNFSNKTFVFLQPHPLPTYALTTTLPVQ